MTTQTTTIQPRTKGTRALIGAAAATLALLGGALLWQTRGTAGLPPTHVFDLRQPAASAPALDPAAFSDQEMYARWLQAQAAR